MIVDGHVHVTEEQFGSIETYISYMENSKIDRAVIVPGGMIDSRRITKYITGEEKARQDYVPNVLVENAINKYPNKFYGFYCVNPQMGEDCVAEFEKAIINKGFSGLKLAPLVHTFSLSSSVVMELAECCGRLGVPFYTHVLYSPGASTSKVGMLAKMFPHTNFILGHMGFGPADVDAVEFANKFDNFYLETSQGSFLIIQEAVNRCGSHKVIFGSESPLYNPKAALETIYALDCSKDDLDNILHKNIISLLNVKSQMCSKRRSF